MVNPARCSKDSDHASSLHNVHCFILIISLLISAIKVKPTVCVIPEASQEGPLRSFNNYEDITFFHYNVPKEVLRATWQFAAFMDDSSCPQRKVNIFLRWGSYPVINVNNATYPSHMLIVNNGTVQVSALTAFRPKSNTIVPIYSPEPGDWFVGAYLSHWDEDIHQKGLGHKCQYSFGSVAIWSEITGVQNIPLGYQRIIKTSETISYYKIFIPKDTWNFEIDVWGCNFTLKKNKFHQTPCIKHLAVKARALPFHNHSSSVGKLSSMDTYTFSELFPYQDSWYYLMVVTSSAITFNVKVSVFDCPIKTLSEVYALKYMNGSLYRSSSKLPVADLKNQSMKLYSMNQSESQENSFYDGNNDAISLDDIYTIDSCIPRYQLVRIQNVEAFSRDYLFQHRGWLTSWLALTDRYPVIAEFVILPLVDIGGTLSININLETAKNFTTQQMKIDFCISRGRVPKQLAGHIKCDNEKIFEISTSDEQNASLLIPYPQPGTWYIAFQAGCIVNGIPAHCEMEEIMVSVDIKLQACVFKGSHSCGEYGICEEIQTGSLFYSVCKCFGGRQGLGCDDSTNAISKLSIILTTLALTLSNLSFIPAAYLAYKRKLYTESLVYSSTMVFSSLYHACDQQFTTYCIARYDVLQYCDFFFGRLSFWVTFIAMADISLQYRSFFHMSGAVITTFAVESDKTGLFSNLLPLTIGMLIPLYSYGYDCFEMKKVTRPRRFIQLLIGLLLAGLGIALLSLVETESNYKYVHSAWHVIIAISLIFLLPPEKIDRASIEQTTSELLNNRESPDGSVFNVEETIRENQLIAEIA